jgi:hypothetical protein
MQDWAKKQIEEAMKLHGIDQKKKGKINSNKVEFDGYTFDSQVEFDIYFECKLDPKIRILEVHPSYPLFPAFTRGGKNYADISYTADLFIYNGRSGQEEVIEVKSKGTRDMRSDYPLRKKLFLMRYPELVFREIVFDRKARTENLYKAA